MIRGTTTLIVHFGDRIPPVNSLTIYHPFLRAARERGCQIQAGTDTVFEQIPLYLAFFEFGRATPDELRAAAMLA